MGKGKMPGASNLSSSIKTIFGFGLGLNYLSNNMRNLRDRRRQLKEQDNERLRRAEEKRDAYKRKLDSKIEELKVQGELEEPIHRWHISGDVYLWLVDYYMDPKEKVAIRTVTDNEFSNKQIIKVTESRRFKFEGKVYIVPSKHKPRMYNPQRDVLDSLDTNTAVLGIHDRIPADIQDYRIDMLRLLEYNRQKNL